MAKPSTSVAIFLIAICAHLTGVTDAHAAETWRCGNTYTDQPCKGGKAVEVDDSRSEADRRASDAATRRAEVRSVELERTRLKQEKDAADRDRKAAAEAQRNALAERRIASAERLERARIRKLDREPRKSTMKFKGA
ncbi:hypothetical protein ACSFA8_16550 [Variovorax sp. RT4R15]|uniref:hypothetical protein n=1 Tax=Variovorax sp. RT4R15 TaxID=3443737 RepID=UPI003F48A34A